MKKAFAVALGAALAGGLVWSALGTSAVERVHTTAMQGDSAGRTIGATPRRRAVKAFDGRFKENGPDTFILIKARFKDGFPTKITRMRYRANMECDTSGTIPGEAGWVFHGALVNDERKFKIRGNNGLSPQSTLFFKGKFNLDLDKIKGIFKTKQWFDAQADPPLPAEYCRLARTRYSASR
jgi:hypothetical protein